MLAAASVSTVTSCSQRVLLARTHITHHRLRGMSVKALGWPFFSKKEDPPKGESKTRQLLTWARAAKPSTELAPAQAPEGLKLATFAGGCFWGLELAFQRLPGVVKTSVGYTAGNNKSPTYEEVCSGFTGHAEAVQVAYDPSQATYEQLLDLFFDRVDPTQKNRQGNDSGTQYRSAIYYHDKEQEEVAVARLKALKADLEAGRMPPGKRWAERRLAVQLEPATDYYLAETYHQQYLSKGGRFSSPQSAEKGCTDTIRCYG